MPEIFNALRRGLDVKRQKIEMKNIRYAVRVPSGAHNCSDIECRILISGKG